MLKLRILDIRLLDIRFGPYRFSPKLIPTIVTLLLLYLLYSLGQWQLRRAEFKENQLHQIETRMELEPVDLELLPESLQDKQFRPVSVSGVFSDKSFLLDNQVVNGAAGFDVVTPFKTITGKWLLVNRGWLPQVHARDTLPEFETPGNEVRLTGFIRVPYEHVFMLQDQHYDLTRWPVIIQSINIKELVKVSGHEYLPYVVMLKKSSVAGFNRDWPAFKLDSEKNIGYAIQWFGLFSALLMIYFFVNTKRKNDDE